VINNGRLKRVRGNIEQGICPICIKGDWNNIFSCAGTKICRDEIVDKRFRIRWRNIG
jgi:hypothetical protein